MSAQVQKPQTLTPLFKNKQGLAAILNLFTMVCVHFGYPIKLYYAGIFRGPHVT